MPTNRVLEGLHLGTAQRLALDVVQRAHAAGKKRATVVVLAAHATAVAQYLGHDHYKIRPRPGPNGRVKLDIRW